MDAPPAEANFGGSSFVKLGVTIHLFSQKKDSFLYNDVIVTVHEVPVAWLPSQSNLHESEKTEGLLLMCVLEV